MNASDLREEYRRECCKREHGEMLEQARLSFLAGIMSTCAAILEGTDPGELAMSVMGAFAELVSDHQAEEAEKN